MNRTHSRGGYELPAVGTKVFARKRKEQFKGEIVADESVPEGRVLLTAGQRFRTLTAGATHVCGFNKNGWNFWKDAKGDLLRKAAGSDSDK